MTFPRRVFSVVLDVRPISTQTHADFNRTRASVSFLQTPAWAQVKKDEWRGESLGWFEGDRLVGAGLALFKQLPKIKRFLVYLPEGPVIDWTTRELSDWLTPMAHHLKSAGAFGIRMGPPVVARRWWAKTIKDAIADERIGRIGQAMPDVVDHHATAVRDQLLELGWRPPEEDGGFGIGQPRFNFQVPLAGKTPDDVLAGMNQLWRRNIKKAEKSGVEVTRVGLEELPAFHAIYTETAERDHFSPRPLAYFQTMFEALLAEDPDRIRLYLAHHEGELVAGATMVVVGAHAWYTYGASANAKRDVRGANATQWRMITDALAERCTVYDLRGITEGLEADDPHRGLIQFKVGTGGEAVEYLGEWELPLNPVLYAGFDLYMRRRR